MLLSGILEANLGPTFTKKLLNFSAIIAVSYTSIPLQINLRGSLLVLI